MKDSTPAFNTPAIIKVVSTIFIIVSPVFAFYMLFCYKFQVNNIYTSSFRISHGSILVPVHINKDDTLSSNNILSVKVRDELVKIDSLKRMGDSLCFYYTGTDMNWHKNDVVLIEAKHTNSIYSLLLQ